MVKCGQIQSSNIRRIILEIVGVDLNVGAYVLQVVRVLVREVGEIIFIPMGVGGSLICWLMIQRNDLAYFISLVLPTKFPVK